MELCYRGICHQTAQSTQYVQRQSMTAFSVTLTYRGNQYRLSPQTVNSRQLMISRQGSTLFQNFARAKRQLTYRGATYIVS